MNQRGSIDFTGGECRRHRRRRHLDEVEVAGTTQLADRVGAMLYRLVYGARTKP